MAEYAEVPTYQQIVSIDPQIPEAQGKADIKWILFFSNLVNGDVGTVWTPTFTGLTEVGTATKTGIYYVISNALVYFRVIITPGTNTSSVAGTTYLDNFPLTIVAPAIFGTIAGNASAALGTTNASNNRLYTPAWTTVANQIILAGIIEAT